MFPQLHRTFVIPCTLFYFQAEEHCEAGCSLCRTQKAAYTTQGKFLPVSASNMIINVYTSPEVFGVGRQLL